MWQGSWKGSRFGLELLATVHWVLTREGASSLEDVIARVYARTTIVPRSSPSRSSVARRQLAAIGRFASCWRGENSRPGSCRLPSRSVVGADLPKISRLRRIPEGVRDAKGWLSSRMSVGRTYGETLDQAALAAEVDMRIARDRSPSFDKLWRDIESLLIP